MKGLSIFSNLFITLILYGKNYIYDMHFPQQEPKWYFWARSISDDKKGNICIEAGYEVFFLSQQGQISKIFQIKDSSYNKIAINSISVDEEGNIYGLAEVGRAYQLVKIDQNGNVIRWGESYVNDLMYSNGYIYGIGVNNAIDKIPCIIVWDKDLNRVKTFGEYGDGTGKFRSIQGIWVFNSRIYIGDISTDKNIMIYDLDGNFLSEFKFNGTSFGNLCVDNSANIYLFGTALQPHIQKYSSNGNYIKGWGYDGYEPGNFLGAKDIYYLNGKIYTYDYILGRVQIFDTEGNLLESGLLQGKSQGSFYGHKR